MSGVGVPLGLAGPVSCAAILRNFYNFAARRNVPPYDSATPGSGVPSAGMEVVDDGGAGSFDERGVDRGRLRHCSGHDAGLRIRRAGLDGRGRSGRRRRLHHGWHREPDTRRGLHQQRRTVLPSERVTTIEPLDDTRAVLPDHLLTRPARPELRRLGDRRRQQLDTNATPELASGPVSVLGYSQSATVASVG